MLGWWYSTVVTTLGILSGTSYCGEDSLVFCRLFAKSLFSPAVWILSDFLCHVKMASLTDLPAEILSRIITYLPHDDKLAHTMLVCRRLRDIVEPVLYSSITLPDGTEDTGGVVNVLRTLSSRPDLARCVTALSSGRILLRDRDYADFTGLVCLLPRLHVLDVMPVVTDLDLTHLRLKSLLFLFPDDIFYDEGEDPMDIVARHFWMPTLRILQIERIALEGQWGHLFPLERYQTSPIIDLRLLIEFYSYQTHGILPQIILSVKSLRQFTVEFRSSTDIEDDDLHEELSLDVITSALLPHALMLEQMSIVMDWCLDVSRALPKHGLMCFTTIRRLAIPETFLHYCEGSRTQLELPQQLEELQLQHVSGGHWYSDADYQRLPVLARMKQTSLRALKLVVWWHQVSRVGFRDSTPCFMPPEIDTLFDTFQQVEVLFSWIEQPHFKGTPLGHNMFRKSFD